jgi:hypothetical protein
MNCWQAIVSSSHPEFVSVRLAYVSLGHKTMLGMKKTAAGTDLAPSKKKQFKKQSSDEHYDEWSGFEPEA